MVDVSVYGKFTSFYISEALFANFDLSSNMSDKKVVILAEDDESAKKTIDSLQETDFLIINDDCKSLRKMLKNVKCKVISYGLSQKSCVTTSSFIDDVDRSTVISIQRKMPTIMGNEIEEQEFKINISENCNNIHSVLAIVSCALVCDVNIENINKKAC